MTMKEQRIVKINIVKEMNAAAQKILMNVFCDFEC